MENKKNHAPEGSGQAAGKINAVLRERAEALFAQILAAESERYLKRFAHLHDDEGHEAVVRNGFQPQRLIKTGIGPVALRFPKLRCRTGSAAVFRSGIVPRYVRRAREVDLESVWRFTYGMCVCDLRQVLIALLGPHAANIVSLVPDSVRDAWSIECAGTRSESLSELCATELWVECVECDPAWASEPADIFAVIGADQAGHLRLLGLDHGIGDARPRWLGIARSLCARGLVLPQRIHLGAGAIGFGEAIELTFVEENGATAKRVKKDETINAARGPDAGIVLDRILA